MEEKIENPNRTISEIEENESYIDTRRNKYG